jgi:hypothetical protein
MKLVWIFIFILITANVFSQESISDKFNFKNLKESSFYWDTVTPKQFLSFDKWKQESDIKDLNPEWEQTVKSKNNREVVGRFLQCVGTCHIERGDGFFNPNFRSTIYESDEIQTIGESYAWVFLLDGTMVRLSPASSLIINEINIGKSENLLHARINFGNILWMSRLENFHQKNNHRETDALFSPLEFYDANPFIEHKIYSSDRLMELTEENQTPLHQRERLNKLIDQNNGMTNKKRTFAFLTLPNVTLMGYQPVVEMFSPLGGKSYFRKRTFEDQELEVDPDDKESEMQYQLRGYENKDVVNLESNEWMEIDERGSRVDKAPDTGLLEMGEFITKRIPTLLVARELLMEKYSDVLFQKTYDPLVLAKKDGYLLWEKSEMDLRLVFMKEYFRRVETTNLFSAASFNKRMKARGYMLPSPLYDRIYIRKALKKLASFEPYPTDMDVGEQLNSTTKKLWKIIHGIK